MRILLLLILTSIGSICIATPPTNTLDFSISNVTFTQPNLVIAGGVATFQGLEPITVKMWVSVTGVLPEENRYVGVAVLAGRYHGPTLPYTITSQNTQVLPVTSFVGGRWVTATFYRTELELGPTILGASVNQGAIVSETNMSNNFYWYNYTTEVHCDTVKKGRVIPKFRQGVAAEPGVTPPWWSTQLYGYSSNTMHKNGCATTSLAMLFRSYGLSSLSGYALDPGTLNTAMKSFTNTYSGQSMQGYNSKSNVIWANAARIVHSQFMSQCMSAGGSAPVCKEDGLNRIAYKNKYDFQDDPQRAIGIELCSGNPVIIEIPGLSNPSKSHFVLATSTTTLNYEPTLRTFDPARALNYTVDVPLKGIRLFRPQRDPAMFIVSSSPNIEYVVTDPLGHRTGRNPILNVNYNEIPGATYQYFSGIDDSTGGTATTPAENEFSHLDNVAAGTYTVQIYGTAAGAYDLMIRGYNDDGNPSTPLSASGTIALNGTAQYTYTQVNAPIMNLDKQKTTVEDLELTRGPSIGYDELEVNGRVELLKSNKLSSARSLRVSVGNQLFRIPSIQSSNSDKNAPALHRFGDGSKGSDFTIYPDGKFNLKLRAIFPINNLVRISIVGEGIAVQKNIKIVCEDKKCRGKEL